MTSSSFDDYVKRSNEPGLPEYQVPAPVAALLERTLNCRTAGTASHGLRWELYDYPVVFFERIRRDRVTIFILPQSDRKWRTKKELKSILSNHGFPTLTKHVEEKKGRNQLRVKDVFWKDSIKLLPPLVKWSYSNQTKEPQKF